MSINITDKGRDPMTTETTADGSADYEQRIGRVRAIVAAAGDTVDAEAKLARVREYRVVVSDEGEINLYGPCAVSIGCLFGATYDGIDGVTLGMLIDAAAEHEGLQGERAHAYLAEINSDEEAPA